MVCHTHPLLACINASFDVAITEDCQCCRPRGSDLIELQRVCRQACLHKFIILGSEGENNKHGRLWLLLRLKARVSIYSSHADPRFPQRRLIQDSHRMQPMYTRRLRPPSRFIRHPNPNQTIPTPSLKRIHIIKVPFSKSAPAYDSSRNQYAHKPSRHSADSPASSADPPRHHASSSAFDQGP